MFFYGEWLLAPCPTPKLEGHPSSAVRGCLFNLFTATLHIGGHASIRNLRTPIKNSTKSSTTLHILSYLFDSNFSSTVPNNLRFILSFTQTRLQTYKPESSQLSLFYVLLILPCMHIKLQWHAQLSMHFRNSGAFEHKGLTLHLLSKLHRRIQFLLLPNLKPSYLQSFSILSA